MWECDNEARAQDRSHRIGQQKQVRVYRLIAENTMEERILSRARQKLILDAMIIKKAEEASALSTEFMDDDDDSGESAMNQLSLEELFSFLSHGVDQIRDPCADRFGALTDDDLVHADVHACMHTYMHAYIHASIHAYMHTYIHKYIHAYIHAYIYVHSHTHTHTHTHTHI